jgi:hypothetical protein
VNKPKSFNLALNTTFDPTLPTLCIVTRIYWAQIPYFPVLALALYHTGLGNIRIYVVNTDYRTDIPELEQTIKFINDIVLHKDFVTFLDLDEPPMEEDFGYGMTDRALTYLYKQHENSPSKCQYVTVTNGDNFYSRSFAKQILPYMKTGKDIIAWGFLSHHYKPQYQEFIDKKRKTVPQVMDDGTEKCATTELRNTVVDLGAVTYRLSFLYEYNLYFARPDGSYSFGSDGYFVEEAAKRTNTSIILRQTFFIHQ